MSHQSILSCARCGAEATVVDDDGDFFMEQLDEWNEYHAHCAEPEQSPLLAAWSELVETGHAQTVVRHNGDASKTMLIPRPGWADPLDDWVSLTPYWDRYRSERVHVPLTLVAGTDVDPGVRRAASFVVRATLHMSGPAVALGLESDGNVEHCANLTVTEARQLAKVLDAAADLAESEINDAQQDDAQQGGA